MLQNDLTGLDSLLLQDLHARKYFETLPSYVQRLIHRGGWPIRTELELYSCADRILRGLHS